MKSVVRFRTYLVCSFVCLASWQAALAQNLIQNGDFSQGLAHWETWDVPRISAAGGEGKIVGRGASGIVNARFVQTVSVQAQHYYRLSFRMRTENVTGFFQTFVNDIGGATRLDGQILSYAATQGYVDYSYAFTSDVSTSVIVYLGCWGDSTGAAYVTGVSLVDVSYNFIQNGSFAQGLTYWQDWDVPRISAAGCEGKAVGRGITGIPNARFVQYVSVLPQRTYRLSFRMRTENVTGSFAALVNDVGGATRLAMQNLTYSASQGYVDYSYVFNSDISRTVIVYVGVWGDSTGNAYFTRISLVDTVGAPPLDLAGWERGRWPSWFQYDYGTNVSAAVAPLQTSTVGNQRDSDTYIRYHATAGLANQRYMDMPFYKRTTLEFPYETTYDSDTGPNTWEWAFMHFIQVNNSRPFSRVKHSRPFYGIDGFPDANGYVTNLYRIPVELQGTAHLMEEGYPGRVNLRGNDPSDPNSALDPNSLTVNGHDRKLFIVNIEDQHIYEAWLTAYDPALDEWRVGSAGYFDASCQINMHKPGPGQTQRSPGASGSGMALGPSGFSYTEIFNTDGLGVGVNGDITHGGGAVPGRLGGPANNVTGWWAYPASRAQAGPADPNALPLGARIRLKRYNPVTDEGFNEEAAFPDSIPLGPEMAQAMRRFCRALQTYGLIVQDALGAGAAQLPVRPAFWDDRWNATNVGHTPNMIGQDWSWAFRFEQGIATWRGGTFPVRLGGRPRTQAPSWEDFEVVQLGWPEEPGVLH